ncbi:MAG: UbiA family prenyltransferase [Planctomycetaceae bacterium]|jgi:4-hydroxybenzoate polyprenyltransferase|nr:UbiA family prenyltransferase [Planctomycetaceae bacterium]
MLRKIFPFLRLLRVANLPTVWSNILAAHWLTVMVYAAEPNVPLLMIQLLAGSCFFLGGMVLNDWYDLEIDRAERPSRPLPSGQISVTFAGWLGFMLLAAGTAAALVVSLPNEIVIMSGITLPVWILCYEILHKRGVFYAATFMAICRAKNIAFVSYSTAAFVSSRELSVAVGSVDFYLVVVALYIFFVTIIASYEARWKHLQAMVGWMLLAIIPLDALICLLFCGWQYALILLALFPLPFLLRKTIPLS